MTPADKPDLPEGTPERLYLTLGTDDGIVSVPFSQLDEVAWCEDQIEGSDPEYIRADVVQRLLADERRKALEEAARECMLRGHDFGKEVDVFTVSDMRFAMYAQADRIYGLIDKELTK